MSVDPKVIDLVKSLAFKKSLQQIANELNKQNLPTPSGKGSWFKGMVARIVREHCGESDSNILSHKPTKNPSHKPTKNQCQDQGVIEIRISATVKITCKNLVWEPKTREK